MAGEIRADSRDEQSTAAPQQPDLQVLRCGFPWFLPTGQNTVSGSPLTAATYQNSVLEQSLRVAA